MVSGIKKRNRRGATRPGPSASSTAPPAAHRLRKQLSPLQGRLLARQPLIREPEQQPTKMESLIDLPNEMLKAIFANLHPIDLHSVEQTCRRLHDHIEEDAVLWRNVFLRMFDEPPKEVEFDDFWKLETQFRIRLQKVLQSTDEEMKRDAVGISADTISEMMKQADPNPCTSKNIQFLRDFFCDPQTYDQNTSIFLFSSSLYCAAYGRDSNLPAETEEQRQASAHLHSLFGIAQESIGRTRSQAAHSWARGRVYDLRQYCREKNFWGPYLHDGQYNVDWEKIEAIMIVLGYNLKIFSDRANGLFPMVWDQPFEGCVPNSYVSRDRTDIFEEFFLKKLPEDRRMIEELDPTLDALDPFGVTGTYRRVVCFLDYSDFHAFNFPSRRFLDEDEDEDIPFPGLRGPIDTHEAIRLIVMKVKVTKIEEPTELDHQDYPVVHFEGTSRSMHSQWDDNANSLLEGMLTPFHR